MCLAYNSCNKFHRFCIWLLLNGIEEISYLFNTWASKQFNSHWYPTVPGLGMNSDENSSKSLSEAMIYYWVAVCIACKQLYEKKDNWQIVVKSW